jgi:hypothetical protein
MAEERKSDPQPPRSGASGLREEIEALIHPPASKADEGDENAAKRPKSLREAIHERMKELDQKKRPG